MGGLTDGWATITGGEVWAEVKPMRAFEINQHAHTVGKVSHRVRIRAGLTVTTKHRVLYGSRVLAVVGVMQPDERGRFMELLCNEVLSGRDTDDGAGD